MIKTFTILAVLFCSICYSKNNYKDSKYEESWKQYVQKQIDSLSKLPGTTVSISSDKIEIVFYDKGKKQTLIYENNIVFVNPKKIN